jgi:hypothetical protein
MKNIAGSILFSTFLICIMIGVCTCEITTSIEDSISHELNLIQNAIWDYKIPRHCTESR